MFYVKCDCTSAAKQMMINVNKLTVYVHNMLWQRAKLLFPQEIVHSGHACTIYKQDYKPNYKQDYKQDYKLDYEKKQKTPMIFIYSFKATSFVTNVIV